MSDNSTEDSDVLRGSAKIDFTTKTCVDHGWGVVSHPVEIIAVFVSVLGALCLLAEVARQFVSTDPRSIYLYAMLVATSAVIALSVRIVSYRSHCPLGFEGRSARARKLAHLQPPRWETRLAQVLVAELVIPIDRECQDLLSGNQFVIATRPESFAAYHRWQASRGENLIRMVRVSQQLLSVGLSKVLGSKSAPQQKAIEILGWVEAIARLYRETVRFEQEGFAVLVPKELEELHALLTDWSETVRDAIRQCLVILDRISKAPVDSFDELDLSIVYKPSPNVDAVVAEYDRLASSIEEHLRDW
jgi:hypothetical protein